MIAVVWRVAGLLWAGGVLLTVAAIAAGAAADRRDQREQRRRDVQEARARQIPASIVAHDDGCLTPDESYQWVLIVDGFGPRGSAA